MQLKGCDHLLGSKGFVNDGSGSIMVNVGRCVFGSQKV